jgi:hypothetical protein
MRAIRTHGGAESCRGESMSFLRHQEIYQLDEIRRGRNRLMVTPSLIELMSLRLIIPGGLHSCRARFRFTSRLECATGADRLQVGPNWFDFSGGLRQWLGAENGADQRARFIT